MSKKHEHVEELAERYIQAAKEAGLLDRNGELSETGEGIGFIPNEKQARNLDLMPSIDFERLDKTITLYSCSTIFEKETNALIALGKLRGVEAEKGIKKPSAGGRGKDLAGFVKDISAGNREAADAAHEKLYGLARAGNAEVTQLLSLEVKGGRDRKGAAAALLGDIGSEEATDALTHGLYYGKNANVVSLKACAEALGKLDYRNEEKKKGAISALEGSGGLGSPYDRVKLASANALAKIGTKSSLKVLEAAYGKEPPEVLANAIESAMEAIMRRGK